MSDMVAESIGTCKRLNSRTLLPQGNPANKHNINWDSGLRLPHHRKGDYLQTLHAILARYDGLKINEITNQSSQTILGTHGNFRNVPLYRARKEAHDTWYPGKPSS